MSSYAYLVRDTLLIMPNRAIEENVYETCPDLVSICTVVGDRRPFPALFIESKDVDASLTEEYTKELQAKVLERISEFHSNLSVSFIYASSRQQCSLILGTSTNALRM